MLAINKFRALLVLLLTLAFSACVTLPGHRQIIDEDGFYLYVKAPNKATKDEIRFNAEKTELLYLPSATYIELVVDDAKGKHQLNINNLNGEILYKYSVNGRQANFGAKEQSWFASLIPEIISKTRLKYDLGKVEI